MLAVELRDYPEVDERIRVIASLGPSTNMPLVASAAPDTLRGEVREAVAGLGADDADGEGLGTGVLQGFARLEDPAYDDIRRTLDDV